MMAWLRYAWLRLGAAGRLGFWLLLGAGGLWAAQIRPAETEASTLQAQLAAARQARPTAPAPRRIADFYQHFPDIDRLPDQLAALDRAANDVGLRIGESHYQLTAVSGLALQRYQVDLPLDGDYTALRQVLNRALQEAGNAVLDEVRFERDEQRGTVSVRLRLSYYYRTDAAEAKP